MPVKGVADSLIGASKLAKAAMLGSEMLIYEAFKFYS